MRWVEWLLQQSVRPAKSLPSRKARLIVQSLEDRSVPSVAGFVFRDLDGDAVRDVGTPQTEGGHTPAIVPRTEPGVAGVTVRAFAPGSNVPIESVFTAADGSYTLTTSLPSVRVEFSNLPAGFSFGNPAPQAAASNVRFVDASTNPAGVNLATVIASQASPYLVTPKYTQGNQLTGPNAAQTVVVGIPYNATGNTGTLVPLASAAQVGTTWAVASNSATGSVYLGAYMKRFAGFGPSGTGAIYKLQPVYNNLGQLTGSQTPVLFADLSVVLGGAAGGDAATTGDNPHPNTFNNAQFFTDNDGNNDGTPDTITNGSIGKIGIGGMVMSPDNQFLYVVNLNTRQLVRLGVDANGNFNGTHAEFNVPVPAGVVAGDMRPFAVQFQNGQVYVGLVDSAESTGVRSNLRGFVYTFNPGTTTFSPAPVLQFQLDYNHGDANVQKANNPPPTDQPNNGFYQPWNAAIDPTTNGGDYYATPMLTDIVFDDTGAMIIGIRDREGDQSGPGTVPDSIFGMAGDVLRATPNGGGGFNLEGQPGGPVGLANGQGPNGQEFYSDDNFVGFHNETSLGGLAVLPGAGQVVVNSTDPGNILNAAGPAWMDNSTGLERDNFNVYINSTPATFQKANGLGDLQIIYAPGALTIGNRVWYDTNDNGLQDANEPGLQGVTVQLFQGGALVGSTTTNALGEYVFDDTDVNNGTPADTTDDGVRPNTAYQIRIARAQAPLTGKRPSTPNTGADNIDSDGVDNGTTVTYDVLSGPTGTFDDNSDFGFVPRMSLGNRIWNDLNNNGAQDAGEAGITGVVVELLNTGGTVVASTTSIANGIYEFTNLSPGDYRVRLAASNFQPGGALEGYASSTGANGQATGPFEGAATPDPDTTPSDTDDNGTTVGTLGGAGVIQSALVTLDADAEPLAENPGAVDATVTDANSNLTVDFGVFQKHSLGNVVFDDANNNGTQDAGEAGINNVLVNLYDATGVTLITGSTTNAQGQYLFTLLAPGSYVVEIAAANFNAGGPLAAYRSSTGTVGSATGPSEPAADPDNNTDGVDDGTTTGTLGAGGVVRALPVTLGIDEPLSETPNNDTTSGTPDNQGNLTVDFGFFRGLSLGNQVFLDANNDGTKQAAEAGINGVLVELLSSTGALVASTTTATVGPDSGVYRFDNLGAGQYRVRITAANFTGAGVLTGFNNSTVTQADPDTNIDSDNNGVTVGTLGAGGVIQSNLVTLTSGNEPITDGDTDPNTNLTVDFGVNQMHSLGNVVFNDANNNGTQDAGEAGINNVLVNLYDATGVTLITGSTTNAQGQYLFTLLAPGSYVVEIAAANFNAGGPLAAYRSSTGTVGSATGPSEPAADPDNNTDTVDDGTTTGTLGAGGVVRALPVTLASDEPLGEIPNNDATGTPDNQSNLTVDFGFFRGLSLGNQVFLDSNNDGTKQAGETGINGVLVELLNPAGGVVASTTTATVGPDSGVYRFDNLGAGQYRVRLTSANFTGAGVLTGFSPSAVNQTDPNSDIDNDNNGITVGTLGAGGVIQSNLVDLTVGNEPTSEDGNANTNLTLDFGVFSRHSIGNRVFNDVNNNGTQDAGEAGISNVSVQLLDGTGTTILTSTTTDLNGLYLFTGIAPGTYVVRIPAANFTSALSGFSSSTGNPGFTTPTPFEGAATPDADTTPSDTDDNGTTISGNVQSLPVTIDDAEPTGETPNNDPGTPDNLSNLTVDFGFFEKAAITGRVYVDQNANGVIDPADTTGLAGITIQAVGPTGTFTTTTAADGSYSFNNIPAGTYTVSQPTQPPGFGSSTPNNPPAFLVPANTTGVMNFGETRGMLTGRVWLNYNNQPDFNGPDTPIPGVTVTLTGTEAGGAAVNRTTTTDASGNYTFADVAGGNYVITETQPTGGTFPPNTDGIDYIGTVGSPGTAGPDSFTLVFPGGTTQTGYNFTEIPLVSLAGSVFEDLNNNGSRDSGEPGISGVVVTLTGTNVSGTVVNTTATTNGTGAYTFPNLQPGTNYTVTEGVVPAPFLDGKDQNGTPAATGTGVNDVFSGIDLTTVATGGTGFNFGEVRPTSVAGQVYVDVNNNGLRDVGEAPISGVTVRLTGTDDTGAGVSLNTTTDLTGAYSFPNLRPGTYTVSEVQPTAFGDGLDTLGNRGGNNATNDVLSNIVLNSGQAGTGYNFGESNSLDLAITQSISKTVVKVGEVVTITYNVRNNGPSVGTGVVMSAPLPSGLAYVGTVFTQQGTYNPATGVWTIGTLPNGAATTLQIQVRVTRPGTFANPASVSGTGTETTLANNFANVPITATIPASQITKRRFLSSSFG